MAYRLKIAEKDVTGKGNFVNGQGHTECAEFVRQATGAPETRLWKKGTKVPEAKPGEILRGTAICHVR
jgi:hypothetical protein